MSVSRPMSVGRLVLYGTAVALAVTARTAAGQGAVTGQVTITERPGETTNDLGNTVVYLDAAAGSAASRVKVPELKEQMAMQSRQFAPRVRVVVVTTKAAMSRLFSGRPIPEGRSQQVFKPSPLP